MLNAFKFFAPLLLVYTLCSCAFVSFEELETNVSVGEKAAYYDKEYLTIDFSIGMDKFSVENLLSLKEDGKRQDAVVNWRNNSCLIKSLGGFKKGSEYTISLQGDVYADDGRKYGVNIYRTFIFGTEGDAFKIIDVQEKRDGYGDISSVVFLFNKAADPSYFDREFILSPTIEVNKNWAKDFLSVEIAPQNKWKANAYYSWSVNNIFSQDKVKIFKEYKGTFLGAKKEKAPELLTACPAIGSFFLTNQGLQDLLENQSVGLIFDCEMDEDSVARGIFFTPSTQGYFTKIDPCRFTFTPYKNYQIQEEYRLTISDAVEDKWGVNFKDEKNIYFKVKTDFIEIEKITFNTKEIYEGLVNKAQIENDAPSYIKITFTKNLDKKALQEIKSAIKFEGIFPQSLQNPRLTSIQKISDNCVELSYTNLFASASGQENVYKLTVRGGQNFIFDSQGEYVKEDKCFYISSN